MKNLEKNITYTQMDEKGLELIAPLWRKLTQHHKERAHDSLKEYFEKRPFKERKHQLLDKSKNGAMLIDLAQDKQNGKYIGYCVSTVDEKKHGELESIFIDTEYRKCGIGDYFMKNAIKWMDNKDAIVKTIAVAGGNEEVLGFYSRYGFFTRAYILMQAEKKH